jgi:putative ABC transport system ATP-binding protein
VGNKVTETEPGPLIEARRVVRIHRQGRREVAVLRGVDLAVAPGEFVTIMGPSGSGKSTLLHLLGGLDLPSSGSILFQGKDLRAMSDRDRSLLRRREIGFVFQRFNLLPTMTAAENAALPLLLEGLPRREALARAEAALEPLGLADRASHFPDELSGGEMQRVAIARALVIDPSLVLCDEPTGALDSHSGQVVLELLRALPEPGKRSVVMVTHDPEAASLGDRRLAMRDGLFEHALVEMGDGA